MWSSFTIASPDPPAVVRNRLSAALTTAAPGWLSGETTFRGEVGDLEFRVIRNSAHMESNPTPIVATGRITATGTGTTIEVRTRPKRWDVLFMCLWSALWTRLILGQLLLETQPGGIDWWQTTILAVFASLGYMLWFAFCTIEERRYRAALTLIVAPSVKHDFTR